MRLGAMATARSGHACLRLSCPRKVVGMCNPFSRPRHILSHARCHPGPRCPSHTCKSDSIFHETTSSDHGRQRSVHGSLRSTPVGRRQRQYGADPLCSYTLASSFSTRWSGARLDHIEGLQPTSPSTRNRPRRTPAALSVRSPNLRLLRLLHVAGRAPCCARMRHANISKRAAEIEARTSLIAENS